MAKMSTDDSLTKIIISYSQKLFNSLEYWIVLSSIVNFANEHSFEWPILFD